MERLARVSAVPATDRSWEEPGAFEVSPGVFRIPLPLPGDGLRAVNVYALESDGGVTLIDSGMSRAASWEALTAGLALVGAELGDVRRVLVTHIHRDHFGQACAVREQSGATVVLGRGEQRSLEYILDDSRGDRRAPWIARLRRNGAAELVAELALAADHGQAPTQDEGLWELPDSWADDGEVIEVGGRRGLVAIQTPGHTRGHLTFMDAGSRLLFAGDHVLPHITPSIGFEPLADGLPLADFLLSLTKVRDLDVDTVLPAHGPPFSGLVRRVDELLAHHAARLRASRAALSGGSRTAFDVARELPWTRRDRRYQELDGFNRQLAVQETAAHLDLLVSEGSVQATTIDGVVQYRASD